MTVAVLIPVLGRPANAARVAESIRESDARATPLFLVSPGDDAELAAVEATGEPFYVMKWPGGGNGDYARKMNYGFREARADFEWVFLGADDLVFYPGWFDACLRRHAATYACVVGTNDLGNPRTIRGYHSTHTLVHRDYLECGTIDEDGKILHEGYDHQYVDDEFIQTAMFRRTYVHAHDARVEHLHPNWGKSVEDETYRRGAAHFDEDRSLFERRQAMWSGRYPTYR